MSTAALRLTDAPMDSTDEFTRVRQLERDNKSLKLRNAALLRAVNGAETVSTSVMKAAAPDGLLQLARTIEASGKLPAVRFLRDANGVITDLELCLVHVAQPELETPEVLGMGVLA